jgi:hypothetical protein
MSSAMIAETASTSEIRDIDRQECVMTTSGHL